MAGTNWKKIEAQYVAGDMSLRERARKKKLRYSTLSKAASKGGWSEKREKFREETAKKALANAQARGAEQLERLMGAAGTLVDATVKALEDNEQFQRFIVSEGVGDGMSETSEKIFSKRDTRAMRDLAGVIKELAPLLREHYGLQPKSAETKISVVMPDGTAEMGE